MPPNKDMNQAIIKLEDIPNKSFETLGIYNFIHKSFTEV